MEQNLSKTKSKLQNQAKFEVCQLAHPQHHHFFRILTCFQPFSLFYLGHMAASKLKIDGECLVEERSMSTSCNFFFLHKLVSN